jgi:lipopolysaccharide transport system permease protein
MQSSTHFAELAPPTDPQRAWHDIVGGLSQWRLSAWFAINDIRRRYRRTTLGPLWQTASFGIFIGALGVLWATLWKTDVAAFLPYLSAGMMVWLLISSTLMEGCNFFLVSGGLVTQTALPYSVFLLAMVMRNVLVMAHQAIVVAAVFLIFPPTLSWTPILAIPALLLLVVLLSGLSLLLAIYCTRFRDLSILVASILQIIMFVTPIFWKADLLQGKQWFTFIFLEMNFIADAISLIREPLLGHIPPLKSYLMVAGAATVAWMLAFACFARYRRVLVLWL